MSCEIAVGAPTQVKGAGSLTRPYLLYPVTIQTPSLPNSGTVQRRYTDFENLRIRLSAKHWYCIIPLLPEKETVFENLGISLSADHQETVGQTRRFEFTRFLKHVYSHPILHTDELLSSFANAVEWLEVLKEPVLLPPFLDSSSLSALTSSLFKKAILQNDFSHDEAAIHVQLRHISTLRDHFEVEIQHRREGAKSLRQFSAVYGQVVGNESGLSLKESITEAQFNMSQLADSKEHRSNEEDELLAILNYWYHMCGAAQQAVKNLTAAHSYYTHLTHTVEQLNNSPGKAAVDVAAVEKLRKMNLEKESLWKQLSHADELQQKQLQSFQHEMTKELNAFLLRYSDIQKRETEAIKSILTQSNQSGL